MIDAKAGVRAWFNVEPVKTVGQKASETVTWRHLLAEWRLISIDFQHHYGIDLSSGVLRERAIGWLDDRILGLLGIPESRLRAKVLDLL